MYDFSKRLSPIRTSLITDLEHEAFEFHDEWQKMNYFLKDIQSFRRELNDIIVGWKEVLSRLLTLNESSQRWEIIHLSLSLCVCMCLCVSLSLSLSVSISVSMSLSISLLSVDSLLFFFFSVWTPVWMNQTHNLIFWRNLTRHSIFWR